MYSIIRLYKNILFFVISIFCVSGNAADKVLAIPIPQLATSFQSMQMIEKELPKSLSFYSPKIVGGTTTGRSEYPEFTQLFVDGQDGYLYAICGATLLASNKVLTAAHCTDGVSTSRFYVLPNFYSFNDSITFSDMIPVITKNEHPNYEQPTDFNNDVAVLTTSRHSNTPTAKIFAGNDPLVGYSATVIGTGVTSQGNTNSAATLRKVTIPIISNDICKSAYGNSNITDSMLCAGLSGGGKDSCQGDSGGPLWVEFNGEKTQAGIVSWGNGCARPNFYGVYARTSALIDFILQYAPTTEIVKEAAASIYPILQLLLLDDPVPPPPPPDTRLHCDNPIPDACPKDGETDYFYYYREPGRIVSQGETNLIRKNNAKRFELEIYTDNGISAFVVPTGNNEGLRRLSFVSANNVLLQVGKYTNAGRYPFQNVTENGIHILGVGPGCNSLTGEFEIFEIEYNTANKPIKLAVNFKQRCSDDTATVFGYFRFNSDLPMHPN